MAITAFTGQPGHGKSYTAVQLGILTALAEKRVVYTNIPLKPKILEDYPDADLRLLDLAEHKSNPNFWETVANGSLVIIDELWRIWPAGLKPSDMRHDDLSFIKEHRHRIDENGRNIDIILVTQDLSDIARSVSQMVEMTVISTQLMDLGLNNKFRRDYYRGPVRGFKGSSTVFIRSDDLVTYDEKVYQYYQSHTKGTSSFANPAEKKVVKATIFQGLKFKALAIGLVIVLIIFFMSLSKTKSGLEQATKSRDSQPIPAQSTPVVIPAPVSPPASPPVAPPVAPVQQAKPPEPALSTVWRLAGFTGSAETRLQTVLLTNGRNHRRISPKFCKIDPDTGEVECIKDGQIINGYSGQPDYVYAANVPLNVSRLPAPAPPAVPVAGSVPPPVSQAPAVAADH